MRNDNYYIDIPLRERPKRIPPPPIVRRRLAIWRIVLIWLMVTGTNLMLIAWYLARTGLTWKGLYISVGLMTLSWALRWRKDANNGPDGVNDDPADDDDAAIEKRWFD
jgi:hypothetical protein